MNSGLTPAAQVVLAIIPIVGIVFVGTLVFFALLWHHRENKLKILKNATEQKSFNFKAFSLLLGMILVAVGLVLTVMFLLLSGRSWALLGGLIPLAVGAALLLFYKVNPAYRHDNDKDNEA